MSQHSQTVMHNTSHELSIKPSISTLAQGSMFWQPEYRQASPWLDHLPFLFWLVEALKPASTVGVGIDLVSHFAICQAISRLRLGSHSYVIGQASSEQHRQLTEQAADQYAGISQWVQENPTRAIQQFNEHSLDLLVLNVGPEDDSIDYLADRWLSRLSDKGIILLPGIARREAGCQAFRAFEALSTRYPHFAFYHGAGVGVLAVGKEIPPLVNKLLGARDSTGATQVVQDVFGRLGRSCQDKVTAHEQQALAQQLEARLSEQSDALTASSSQAKTLKKQYEEQKQAVAKLDARLAQQEERFAHERGRLAERVSSLEALNQELKQELTRQRHQTDQRDADYRKQAQQQSDAQNTQLEQLHSTANKRKKTIADLTTQLEETQHQLAQQKTYSTEQQAQLERAKSELAARNATIERLAQQLEETQQQLTQQRTCGSEQQAQLERVKSELDARNATIERLIQQLEGTQQQLAQQQIESTKQLEQQQTQSTKQLEQAKNELDAANANIERLSQQLEETRQQLQATLQQRLTLQAENTQLSKRLKHQTETEQRLSQAEQRLSQAEQGRIAAEQQLLTLKKETSDLEARLKDSTAREKKAQKAIEERFNEITALTNLLEKNEAQSEQLSRDTVNSSAAKAAKPSKWTIKRQVAMIEKSRYFDAKWYLAQYPDIAQDAKMSANPARHYLLMGGFEGRNPGPEFDTTYYLAHNPDVVKSGVNPLLHYLKWGEKQQRPIQWKQ